MANGNEQIANYELRIGVTLPSYLFSAGAFFSNT